MQLLHRLDGKIKQYVSYSIVNVVELNKLPHFYYHQKDKIFIYRNFKYYKSVQRATI